VSYFREIRNKTPIVPSKTQKLPDLMHCGRRLPTQHILNLARIYRYTLRSQNVTQELNSIQPKLALAELSVQLVLSQLGQNGADMLCMLFFILGIYQDVIDEDHYKLIQL
jgi:hypothetical protein